MLGKHLLFLFENHDSVWYQIQEMIRVERIVRESSIQEEIAVFNELLGASGELGIVLLIAVEESERPQKLNSWLNLLPTLYLLIEGGERIRAQWDEKQVGEDRISSVQYLKFDVRGHTPIAIGSDHNDPALNGEQPLSEDQMLALSRDLNER